MMAERWFIARSCMMAECYVMARRKMITFRRVMARRGSDDATYRDGGDRDNGELQG